MVREMDFKAWLELGGRAETAINTRVNAIRRIERNLSALGMSFRDLDEAWATDRFAEIYERLKQMQADARSGGHDYRIVMPESEKPHNRLSNWRSWLTQYGRFLAGEAGAPSSDADRIRQYVLEHYIEPAREDGSSQVDVLVRDVNTALGLKEAWPNICQALKGRIFQDFAGVAPPAQIGADQSPATTFRFNVGNSAIDREALESLRTKFLALCPDFKTFLEPGTGWAKLEKEYKIVAMERVRSALALDATDEGLGKVVYEILRTAADDGPLVRWETEDSIAKKTADLLADFYAIIGQLIRSDQPTGIALATADDALKALRARGANPLTYGERINILFSTMAMVRSGESAPLKIQRINKAWEVLTREKLFIEARADMATHYGRFAAVFKELFEIMRDEWHWEPQDWLDIQGFLWIAIYPTDPAQQNSEIHSDNSENRETPMSISPVNLILYGPPGTGKTYATAQEAVRLCGETVPGNRGELLAAYQRLVSAGRIEFVTFHQSTSYEDFIEGRQPVTNGASAGFRLETMPGIFRRVAERAAASHGRASVGNAISLNERQVFKMSIGEADEDAGEEFYNEAIKGGYVLLGWSNIDWRNARFADPSEILKSCQEDERVPKPVTAQSKQVQHVHTFRNRMKNGDIIVVSRGNRRFRAIGEVTGDYEYIPKTSGEMCHRRAVKWLWVHDEGLSANEIYNKNFSQQTIYTLRRDELKVLALERLLNSGRPDSPSTPESFVLIIDEINRANISKVFGELITLLEADKRQGKANALKVRLPYSGDEFGVPANLHILGTMNTADRSIALLDTALRRRFSFREMMPEPWVLESTAGDTGINLPKLLTVMNERIEYLYDREHQIGHAYFTDCMSQADVNDVMRHKVIPLLAEYFFEDWAKIAAVLGDLETHEEPINGGFLKRSKLKAPSGLDDGNSPVRFRWEVRNEAEGFNYARLLDS